MQMYITAIDSDQHFTITSNSGAWAFTDWQVIFGEAKEAGCEDGCIIIFAKAMCFFYSFAI